jgi:hypothetical protein
VNEEREHPLVVNDGADGESCGTDGNQLFLGERLDIFVLQDDDVDAAEVDIIVQDSSGNFQSSGTTGIGRGQFIVPNNHIMYNTGPGTES